MLWSSVALKVNFPPRLTTRKCRGVLLTALFGYDGSMMVISEIITGEIRNGHDFWSECGNDTRRLAYGSWREHLDVQDDVEIRNSIDFDD